ncbi:hypothetical protein OE519_00375 [Pseudomonas aeruginosa]|nr:MULTISPECIES: hypothetical protein [Pseudomonadota]MCU8942223.1 hypothetical protein [Pseudomonas aeruginosa]MDH1072030.1 hypothetical protein [Pseudomonas nitroreducens]
MIETIFLVVVGGLLLVAGLFGLVVASLADAYRCERDEWEGD